MKIDLYTKILLTIIACLLLLLILEPTVIRSIIRQTKWYKRQEYIYQWEKKHLEKARYHYYRKFPEHRMPSVLK
jgi:hypothetical protein